VQTYGTRSFTNRLVTRTKESTECASVLVIETKRRVMKVTTCERVGGAFVPRFAQLGSVLIVCDMDLKQSTFAGTRKIASFSWAEGSQGKPWWTFERSADVQIACQI